MVNTLRLFRWIGETRRRFRGNWGEIVTRITIMDGVSVTRLLWYAGDELFTFNIHTYTCTSGTLTSSK